MIDVDDAEERLAGFAVPPIVVFVPHPIPGAQRVFELIVRFRFVGGEIAGGAQIFAEGLYVRRSDDPGAHVL